MGYGTLCWLLMNLLNSELPPMAQLVKNPPAIAMQETQARSLGGEDSPGEGNGNPLQHSWGKPQGQKSLAGYSSWGRKELDMI